MLEPRLGISLMEVQEMPAPLLFQAETMLDAFERLDEVRRRRADKARAKAKAKKRGRR